MHFALLLRILHASPIPFSLVWSHNINICCGLAIILSYCAICCTVLLLLLPEFKFFFSARFSLKSSFFLPKCDRRDTHAHTKQQENVCVFYSYLRAFECQMGRQSLRTEMQAFSKFNPYVIFFFSKIRFWFITVVTYFVICNIFKGFIIAVCVIYPAFWGILYRIVIRLTTYVCFSTEM